LAVGLLRINGRGSLRGLVELLVSSMRGGWCHDHHPRHAAGYGYQMQDVPASYFHWLWTNGKDKDMRCPVADYIRRNLAVLESEHPDGIWQ